MRQSRGRRIITMSARVASHLSIQRRVKTRSFASKVWNTTTDTYACTGQYYDILLALQKLDNARKAFLKRGRGGRFKQRKEWLVVCLFAHSFCRHE
jgi:hypothetical protein